MSNTENKELGLPFVMTDGERISPLWIKVSTELEKKLASLRVKNDNPNMSERETATLRGQIQCFKSILGLAHEPPPTE